MLVIKNDRDKNASEDATFQARRLLELLDVILDDISWTDAWTLSNATMFRMKYRGVFDAVSPRMNVEDAPDDAALTRDMRGVEAGLRTLREQVLWIIERFLPHHLPHDDDDLLLGRSTDLNPPRGDFSPQTSARAPPSDPRDFGGDRGV